MFQVAGGCGLGALQAAKDKKEWGIGVDTDQGYPRQPHPDERPEEGRRGRIRTIQLAGTSKWKGGVDGVYNVKNKGVGFGKVCKTAPSRAALIDLLGKWRRTSPRARSSRRAPSSNGESGSRSRRAGLGPARRVSGALRSPGRAVRADAAAATTCRTHVAAGPPEAALGGGLHMIPRNVRAAPGSRDAPRHEALPGDRRERRRQLRSARGRGPRVARRERRRQVDADEHPLRALPRRRGGDPDQGKARAPRLAERVDRGGRGDGAPALHAHPGDDRGREHRPRGGADAKQDRLRHPRGRAARPGDLGPVRTGGRPSGEDRGHHRRAAAARRDPQGALPRRGHPRPRRADRSAHAAGGTGALRGDPGSHRARQVGDLHHAQAERGARHRRPDHGPAPRQADRDAVRRRRHGGKPRPPDGGARGAAPGREELGDPGGAAAPGRGSARPRRPRHREGPRHLVRGAGRRDRRHGRHRRERPDGADRRARRAAVGRRRDGARRRRGRHARLGARASRGRARPHPGGPPASRARARVLDRREHRAARLPLAASVAVRLALPAPPRSSGPAG